MWTGLLLPPDLTFEFDTSSILSQWSLLHTQDLEKRPADTKLAAAWALFHNGQFHKAYQAGLKLGAQGLHVACKAACIQAAFVETHEPKRLALFEEVAQRCTEYLNQSPKDWQTRFWRAFALSRYSQGISVAKALAQGMGHKIKTDLEAVIAEQPEHYDALVTLGSFHAEVIDKVGSLIGAMAYGASHDIGMNLFERAALLQRPSALGLLDHAHALIMLDGEKRLPQATEMYRQAARMVPRDAATYLEIEAAKAELANL